MAESVFHIRLVDTILAYVKSIVRPDLHYIIRCDMPGYERPIKEILGAIPDVYFWHNDHLIIGEAKTFDDFERPHSKAQYLSYMHACQVFYGKACLIICVPWQIVLTAKNYFKRLTKNIDKSFDIVILNEIGGVLKV